MPFEQLTLDSLLPHKIRGNGPMHAWDCPACVAQEPAQHAAMLENPHRPGTKAWEKWNRSRSMGLWACDPRSETYWSM